MVSKNIIKRKIFEIIRQELLNSSKEDDYVEEPGLNETDSEINNSQEALIIRHCYEDIIKTQNKKAIGYTGKQGQLLKTFKDTEHFFDNVAESRLTIYFKISLHRFFKKHTMLKKIILPSTYF